MYSYEMENREEMKRRQAEGGKNRDLKSVEIGTQNNTTRKRTGKTETCFLQSENLRRMHLKLLGNCIASELSVVVQFSLFFSPRVSFTRPFARYL